MRTRRLGLRAACCAATGALLASGGLAVASAPVSSNLLVYAQEWSLYSSRGTVPAGTVSVQLWNRGQDPHDLRIRHLGPHGMFGQVDGAVAITDPGQIGHATWRLAPGRYELYCSLPGHLMAGMHAAITVTR